MTNNPPSNVGGTAAAPVTVPDSSTPPPRGSLVSRLQKVWDDLNLSDTTKTLILNSTKILSVFGIAGTFGYGTFYARPIWAGIVLLGVTLVTGFRLAKKPKEHIVALIIVALLFSIACSITFFSGVRYWIQRQALASFYSLNPNNIDLDLRRKLLQMTRDHGTWDQVRKVEVKDVAKAEDKNAAFSQITILDDRSPTRADDLLALLRPSNSNEGEHFLTFLVAPFGTGKETIMRQWALALAQRAGVPGERESYRYVFFVNLNAYPDAAKGESWPIILAKSYGKIVDDPAYYELLFKREKCLILVSGVDRLEKEGDRNHLLNIAKDAASNSAYAVDFLFSIRPDTVLRDFAISAELRFDRHVRFLRILDFNKCEWDAYFEQAGLKTVVPKNYEYAKRLVEGDALSQRPSDHMCQTRVSFGTSDAATPGQNLIASKLAVNLDFLNLIVEQAQRLEPKTPGFYLCGEMVSRVMERDRSLDSEQAFQTAFTNMERLALNASLANTTNLEVDGRISYDVLHSLKGAPLLSVEDGRFVFNPDAVQSYFAVRGLNKALIDIQENGKKVAPDGKVVDRNGKVVDFKVWYGKPLPERLLLDIGVFSPLPQELDPVRQYVACVEKGNQKYYSKNREQRGLLDKIIGVPRPSASDCLNAPITTGPSTGSQPAQQPTQQL